MGFFIAKIVPVASDSCAGQYSSLPLLVHSGGGFLYQNNVEGAMPNNHKDAISEFIQWFVSTHPFIYGFCVTVLVALLRLIYDGAKWSRRLIEPIFCGFVALTISAGFDYFGFPDSLSPFIGGVIGLLGVDKLRSSANTIIEYKVKKIKEKGKKSDDQD